jgi:hypothetical protein
MKKGSQQPPFLFDRERGARHAAAWAIAEAPLPQT